MPVNKSKSRINAEQFHAQSKAATDRASSGQYAGMPFGAWLGKLAQQQTAAGRASRDEDMAYAQLQQQEQMMQQLPQQVAGGMAQARRQGVDMAGLSPEMRASMAYNMAQDIQGGGSQQAAAADFAANPNLNPAVAQQMQAEQAGMQLADQQARATLANTGLEGQLKQRRLEQINQAMQFEAAEKGLDRFGTQLTLSEFGPIKDKNLQFQNGIDNTQFLMDVVGSTTPAQMANMPGIKGRIDGTVYGMYKSVQSMSESKESTLRDSEREAIDDFLGDPASFSKGLLTRDARTIEKLKYVQEAMQRNMQSLRTGLDDKTIALLEEAAPRNEAMYGFRPPKDATFRDPVDNRQGLPDSKNPAGTGSGGLMDLAKDAYDFYSDPLNQGQ